MVIINMFNAEYAKNRENPLFYSGRGAYFYIIEQLNGCMRDQGFTPSLAISLRPRMKKGRWILSRAALQPMAIILLPCNISKRKKR
jgi:hypothetical protein